MSLLERLRKRKALRQAAFAAAMALMPATTLAVNVTAAFCQIGEKVKEAKLRAEAVDAKFTVLKDFGGVPIGWGMMKMMRGGLPLVALFIAANQFNFNIRTQALASGLGSTIPANVVTTVNSGIWCGGNGLPGLDTGTSWPSGTVLQLVNLGFVTGNGGTGGNGANVGVSNNGFAGSAGGDAILAQYNLTIDNTNGYILGGCGGGGGGAGEVLGSYGAHGGGGGGGKGFNTGGGGAAGGTGIGGAVNGSNASWGGTLATSNAGGGGDGGNDSGVAIGGAGGPGGGQTPGTQDSSLWGTGGLNGRDSSHSLGTGGAGGGAGNAIRLSSSSIVITWLGGNNTTQVRLTVSV